MRNHFSKSSLLRRRLNLFLHRWHRRVGVSVSIFLIWMACSGWLLNHADRLGLTHRYLTSDFIAQRYGIAGEMTLHAFTAGEHLVVFGEEAILLDANKIDIAMAQPHGALEKDGVIYLADAAQLILLDQVGQLIDKIATPITIEKIGAGCGGVVVANNTQQLVTVDALTFSECHDAVNWVDEKTLSATERARIVPLLRHGVSVERVLLDLHSGRFFGALGPFFVDLIGVSMVMLALSGVWLFTRQRRQKIGRH